MFDCLTQLMSLKNDRRGVTAIEYGLIASLVAVVIIATLTTLGADIANSFSYISTQIATTAGGK
jgi:pilus assembly protein Flp/PilA